MRQNATRRGDAGGSKLDQTNRGVNSTSRRTHGNDGDGKSARVYVRGCVRACAGVRGGACKHSVTNQFSGHRSLEVENADAASYISGIK